jgi:uncharacterized protein (TIGR03083 family)
VTVPPPDWLTSLRAACVAIEEAAVQGPLDAPVRWCPGMDVGQVLRHVGVVHRVVDRWVRDRHRPAVLPAMPAAALPQDWFATGWRPLLERLASLEEDAEASTWCSHHTTAGFWWRRMAHETTIHAVDVLEAVGWAWPVPGELALDGVDEALRLFLGVALGPAVGGSGQLIRLTTQDRFWTVGLNDHNVEVNHLDVEPMAELAAQPEVLYRWVWGRAAADAVRVSGDPGAVRALRSVLARSMQ